MKNVLKLILFIILISVHTNVYAYDIENYYINATIEENGDLLVEEYFELNGYYNGYERVIYFINPEAQEFDSTASSYGGSSIYNAEDIEIIEIKAVDESSSFSFLDIDGYTFEEVNYASNGDYGVYIENSSSYYKSYQIFLPYYKNKAFYIKYLLKNKAVLHNDVGELGWTILTDEQEESIGNLVVYINIPNNKDEFRVWAHGSLWGNSEIINQNQVKLTIEDIAEEFDVRLAFDTSVISSSTKKTGVNALEKILVYENAMADIANEEREEVKSSLQKEAIAVIDECQENPTSYCLEASKNYLDNIYDEELYKEYANIVSEIETTVMIELEEDANYWVTYAEEKLTRSDYQYAYEKVMKLDNGELKTELLERLDKVLEQIEEKEKLADKISTILLIIDSFAIIIYTFILFNRHHLVKSDFKEKYFRDIPEEISPLDLSCLMYGKVTEQAILAVILDLIRKNKISYSKSNNKKDKGSLKILNVENLTSDEKNVISLIFGSSEKISIKAIEKNAKNNYSSYASKYQKVIKDASSRGKKYYDDEKVEVEYSLWKTILKHTLITLVLLWIYPAFAVAYIVYAIITTVDYKKKSKKIIKWRRTSNYIIVINLVIVLFYYFCLYVLGQNLNYIHWAILFVTITSMICYIIRFFFHKKTKEASLSYCKWMALKRFLRDFSKMDEKEILDVNLWEEYLVYGTVLGVAKKLTKFMKIKGIELDSNIYVNYNQITIKNRMVHNMKRASSVANRNARRNSHSGDSWSGGGSSFGGSSGHSHSSHTSHSSHSSGSGHGGGFSSHGSSFGGGGGGHRF